MKKAVLGKIIRGRRGDLAIDVKEFMVGRCIICADSGAGKSFALRRLLEVLYGHLVEWVVDIEGEFASLREIGDFTIVGGEHADLPVPRLPSKQTLKPGESVQADFEAEVAKLVRQLIELKANVVFDLFDLPSEIDPAQRARITKGLMHDPTKAGFVAAFFKALIDLPKKMWIPMVVAVDEAQALAPEEASKHTPAVVPMTNWGTLARKRAQCPVYAFNSLSMIANSAIRGFQNRIIGTQSLDADNKRAAASLGLDVDGRAEVKDGLEKGEFFVHGPALSRTVVKVKVGPVRSTHPRPGEPLGLVPEPSERVKKVLAGIRKRIEALAKDPLQAAIEDGDAPADVLRRRLAAAQTQLKELEKERDALVKELAMAKRKIEVEVDAFEIDKKDLKRLENAIKAIERIQKTEVEILERIDKIRDKKAQAQQVIASDLSSFQLELSKARGGEPHAAPSVPIVGKGVRALIPTSEPVYSTSGRTMLPAGVVTEVPRVSGMDPRHVRVLNILAEYGDEGLSTAQLAALADYSPDSESFLKILRAHRDNGLMQWDRGRTRINAAGIVALKTDPKLVGATARLPDAEHIARWMQCPKFEPRHQKVLRNIVGVGREATTQEIADMSDYSPDSESFLKLLRFFRDLDLINWERGRISVTAFLMRRKAAA